LNIYTKLEKCQILRFTKQAAIWLINQMYIFHSAFVKGVQTEI